jgi:hypothetical protein
MLHLDLFVTLKVEHVHTTFLLGLEKLLGGRSPSSSKPFSKRCSFFILLTFIGCGYADHGED